MRIALGGFALIRRLHPLWQERARQKQVSERASHGRSHNPNSTSDPCPIPRTPPLRPAPPPPPPPSQPRLATSAPALRRHLPPFAADKAFSVSTYALPFAYGGPHKHTRRGTQDQERTLRAPAYPNAGSPACVMLRWRRGGGSSPHAPVRVKLIERASTGEFGVGQPRLQSPSS